ncbi:TetR family transcriptional regulator [Novosphingobium sp. Rr 2-17]|uniref:TetR/AcrR family transcriptional regulator n=1 Tax=Novosphingobium sp. Rr 2-17 TaxID=555793 RepID=UPI000269A847|nr:TetR/AcrR family transcriptional regulator [Novosphingobium sp. Rr 2-17]EIZ78538.1 TetR family transcriptional regulator [Novosphingobium sp. Rr 2-17]
MTGAGEAKRDGESRIDRRRLRTRSALLGAGQKLFADRHIDGVTIDDIVEAADVAKGSFYNHFDGKESLADAIIELVQGDCEREVFAVNLDIEDPSVRVARAMAALIRYARQHPDRYQSMVNLAKRRADINAPINAGARRDIGAGIASGQFAGISVEMGVMVMLSMIAQAVDYISTTPNVRSHKAVAREMAFMLLRALGVNSETAGSVSEIAIADLFNTKG